MRAVSMVVERRLPLFAMAGALVLAVACGSGAPSPMVSADFVAEVPASAPEGKVAGFAADASGSRLAREVAPQSAPPRRQTGSDSAITTMLIRRGDVSIRVDSIEPAMAELRRLAAALRGTVGNASITAGEFAVRSATLELRIPAERFDEAMNSFAPIGKIEHVNVSAEDVAEEYVDIRARVANARRLETRLIDLLATRTGKLEDVLAVERELARVREEIERNEGRVRWLGARVATSTIMVTVSEKAPVVGSTPGQSVIGLAFVQAWRNFVALLSLAIASLGVLLPVAVMVWAAWRATRWWQGRGPKGSMEA